VVSSSVNQGTETRDHGVETFDTETLRGGEFILEEVGEAFVLAQTAQDLLLLFLVDLEERKFFDSVSEPVSFVHIGDVKILKSGFTAVNLLEGVDEFAKLPDVLLSQDAGEDFGVNVEFSVEISIGETVVLVVKFEGKLLALLKTRLFFLLVDS